MITANKNFHLIKNRGNKVRKQDKYKINSAWGVNVRIHGERTKPGATVELDDNEAAELKGRAKLIQGKNGPEQIAMVVDYAKPDPPKPKKEEKPKA